MPLDPRDATHLWDIVRAAEAVADDIAGLGFQTYLEVRQTRSAVERELEIIGEAARRLSDSFREAHPGIPWASIIAQRNVLAHQYDKVDHARVWTVASKRLPELLAALSPLLPPPPNDGEAQAGAR